MINSTFYPVLLLTRDHIPTLIFYWVTKPRFANTKSFVKILLFMALTGRKEKKKKSYSEGNHRYWHSYMHIMSSRRHTLLPIRRFRNSGQNIYHISRGYIPISTEVWAFPKNVNLCSKHWAQISSSMDWHMREWNHTLSPCTCKPSLGESHSHSFRQHHAWACQCKDSSCLHTLVWWNLQHNFPLHKSSI